MPGISNARSIDCHTIRQNEHIVDEVAERDMLRSTSTWPKYDTVPTRDGWEGRTARSGATQVGLGNNVMAKYLKGTILCWGCTHTRRLTGDARFAKEKFNIYDGLIEA